MKNEFRVQFENENGTVLYVLFQTPDRDRAIDYALDLKALNDKYALGHDIAVRECEYVETTGEWVRASERQAN